MSTSARIFEIALTSLSNRLDVTYYLIRNEAQVQVPRGTPVRELCVPIRTKTPSREAYGEEGIPCLKLRNVTGRVLNIGNCDYVPWRLKSRFVTAKKHDLILTATREGTAGRVDIFLEDGEYIVTGENILLRPNAKRINPFCLLALMRSRAIARQLTHFVRGATGQTHLYWHDIADILIPTVDDETQARCERIFREAWRKRRAAAETVSSVKSLIIKAAGIDGLDADKRDLFFETSFDRIRDCLRFDVEFYQPIHDRVRIKLERAGCKPLSGFASLNNNTTNPRRFPTEKIRYVDIRSVDTDVGDYDSISLYGYEAPTRARRKPKNGDILISTVRPNRNAVAVIEDNAGNLVVSTGFAVVTPSSIKPLVLFAVLKTKPIFSQLVKMATAAMYPAISREDPLQILIPDLDDLQVAEVQGQVRQGIQLREESDALLAEFAELTNAAFAVGPKKTGAKGKEGVKS
jgi:type I restriction enzyme S subunit